jgi:5-methylcytosine-specific restriction endonuclease McrA
MRNPRITPKERGLIKGAVRRVFSRSELRRKVLEKSRIEHYDPTRPRVKKWSSCESCGEAIATYEAQVDHKVPLVPIISSLEEMTWDEVVNGCWCYEDLLQVLCQQCHGEKTKEENKARREHKKGKKK